MNFSFLPDIRPALECDLAVLESLAVTHGYKEADYFTRCLAEQRDGRRAVFLAMHSGKGIGYVMLNRRSLYQPFRSAKVMEIQDLFVIPDVRRQGVGATLIKACETFAREDGGTMVGLAVGLHSGYGAAQRLYVRLGYVPDGFGVVYDMQPVRPHEKAPVDDDLCLMMVKNLA